MQLRAIKALELLEKGLTTEQIAERMGITIPSVNSLIWKARQARKKQPAEAGT